MWRGSGDLVATRDASPLNVSVASGDHSPPCAFFYLVIVIVQHWSCYSDHTSSVDRLQLTHTPGRHLAPSQAVSRASTLPQHRHAVGICERKSRRTMVSLLRMRSRRLRPRNDRRLSRTRSVGDIHPK